MIHSALCEICAGVCFLENRFTPRRGVNLNAHGLIFFMDYYCALSAFKMPTCLLIRP
jgi:hypothetical protein